MSAIFDDIIRVGDVGITLKTNVTRIVSGVEQNVDLTTATGAEIILQKPSGEVLSAFTGTITDALNGEVQYKDTVGVFDVAGRWKVRGRAIFATDNFKGSWHGFPVDE